MRRRIPLLLIGILTIATLAAPAHAADANLSGPDKEFATKTASGGLMEVQLGQIANNQAQAPEVKEFGNTMVQDHSAANNELKKIAQQKNLTLPTQMDAKHQATVDKLKGVSGADFDRQYMREMVKDHAKDVQQFRNATQSVKDPDLNAWATKTLPVLEKHLQKALTTAQKLGIDVKKAEEEGRQEAQKEQKEKKEK
jgi:putative membrane protein